MIKKISSLVCAGLLMSCMLMVPVSAATNYTPVAGSSCNFNKYLIMDAGDSVPNATFAFTVAPGQAVSASTSSSSHDTS